MLIQWTISKALLRFTSILVLFSKIIVIEGTPSLFLQIVWKPSVSAICHSKLHPHTGNATSSEQEPHDTQQSFYLSVPWFSYLWYRDSNLPFLLLRVSVSLKEKVEKHWS